MKYLWWRKYQDETAGDGTDAGGGAAAAEAGGEAAAGGEVAPPDKQESAAAGTAKNVDPMQAEIDKALGYEPGKDGKAVADPKKAEEDKAAADAKAKQEADAKAVKDRDAKAAAGDQEAIRAKAAADAKAKADAAKPKDLKALELTPEEKKAMAPKTAARYQEVLTAVKTERAAREAAEAKVQGLAEARDAIVSVLKETNTSDDDLAQLLEYNRLTKSGRPEDLDAALKVVNSQRLALLKALGRPGDDYDPLQDPANKDLAADVEDQKITRERALELAASRRREAIAKGSETRATAQQEKVKQLHAAMDTANNEIDLWCADMARTDIDYKAKERILGARIDKIVADNPPDKWLPLIKSMYELITVPKAAVLPKKEDQPLRPGGPKPGGPAPKDMAEAIDQGLGYSKT